MKRIVSFGEFFSTLGLGLWQAVCWVFRAFDPRHKTKFWRVIWGVWTTALVLLIVCLGFAFWYDECKSFEWEGDRVWLSNSLYYQPVHRGTDYFFNVKTGKKVLKGVENFCQPSNGDTLAVFFKDGKRGYFSIQSGEIVLPAVYEQAWIFSDGVAMVVRDDSLRIIDGNGKERSRFWYSRAEQMKYDRDYVFRDGLCKVNTADRKIGLVDRNGAWVVPAVYETIWREEYGAIVVYGVTKKDTENGGLLYGVIDCSGNELIPCIYKSLSMNDEEGIFVTDTQHYQWRIDLEGNLSDEPLCYSVTHLKYIEKMVTRPTVGDEYEYEDTSVDVTSFAPLYSYTSSEEGYMGLMDANGHRLTPPIYRSIKAINAHLYCCGYDTQYDNAVLLNIK